MRCSCDWLCHGHQACVKCMGLVQEEAFSLSWCKDGQLLASHMIICWLSSSRVKGEEESSWQLVSCYFVVGCVFVVVGWFWHFIMLQRLYHHIAEVFCSGVFPQVITRESLLVAQVGPLFPSLFAISSLGHLKTFFIYNHHAWSTKCPLQILVFRSVLYSIDKTMTGECGSLW